jgi:hypothetical protein
MKKSFLGKAFGFSIAVSWVVPSFAASLTLAGHFGSVSVWKYWPLTGGRAVPAHVLCLAQMKGGGPLEPITDIIAYTVECRDEAIEILQAVQAGAALATEMTRERAVQMLSESIVFYEQMLRRYGWRDDA